MELKKRHSRENIKLGESRLNRHRSVFQMQPAGGVIKSEISRILAQPAQVCSRDANCIGSTGTGRFSRCKTYWLDRGRWVFQMQKLLAAMHLGRQPCMSKTVERHFPLKTNETDITPDLKSYTHHPKPMTLTPKP